MNSEEMKDLFRQGWLEVLQTEEVDDDTDFFEAGGNSIMAVQLPSWLVQKGIKLDIMDIFMTPTFGELATKLKETDPLYMPEEMITKEVAARAMGFASVEEGEKAELGLNFGPKEKQVCTPAEQKGEQVCTPAEQKGEQVCTPAEQKGEQVCTPAEQKGEQVCTPAEQRNSQVCTPTQQWNGQVCTPTQQWNGQVCTPTQQWNGSFNMPMQLAFIPVYIPMQMGYAPAFGGQVCTPIQQPNAGGQICTPKYNQGYSAQNAENIPEQLRQYFPRHVDKAIEKPNVVKISKPKITEKTKSPEKALMDVMIGILPTFDRNKDFFEQGITSMDTVKMVTRCGEAGYELAMKDIYMHSTFDELLGYLK